MVGTRKGKKKGKSQKTKAPTISQEEEPTSPELNNKEDQKEEEKRNDDGDTAAAAGTTNPEDSDSSKEKENSTSEENTETNLTAKATSTTRTGNHSQSSSSASNEEKQNEDTNEVIVSNFLDWYANQTFGRSSATTPPVDIIFDTQTNTFIEQVPNIAEKFDMSTWVKPKSTGSPPVKPGVETSNDDDIYVFATGTISIDLLPLFTHRSLGGSNLLFRPDINHRRVFIPNVTRPTATGKPGMWATALSNDGPNFHGNKMGLMFYSALHPDHAQGRTGFILESFTDIREHVPTVADLTTKARFTGPVTLKNELAYPVSAAEFHMLMNYFDIDVVPINRPPTPGDYEPLLSKLQGVHLATMDAIRKFITDFNIPLNITNEMTYPQARFLLTVHYQMHCPVRIGAWEGCHRVYTAATLVEALKPSPFLPCVPGNAMDDVGFLNKNSAVFKSVTVEVAGMKNAEFTQEFFKNIKDNGRDITASMSHAIEPSWRSVFLNAVEVVREAVAEKKVIMLDDTQSNFITSKFLRKEPNQYFDNCAYLTPKLFQTAVDDVFLKKTMTDWLEAEKITADTLLERMQAQFSHGKPFIINFDTRLMPSKFYYPGYPRELLYFFQVTRFGMMTEKSLHVFREFFGEPNWTTQGKMTVDIHGDAWLKKMVHFVWRVQDIVMKAVSNQQEFATRFRTAAKGKVKTLLLHNTFMDIMKTINKFGPNPTIRDSQQPVAVAVSTGHFNTVLEVMLEHYCEYLELVVKGQKQHLPPTYKPDKAGKPMDTRDTTLKIQSKGPETVDHGDFPEGTTVDHFALYKNFTLFEIVNELVTKEEPLYFNPPNLESLIAKPNSKKRGTADAKGNATKKYRFHLDSFINYIAETGPEDLQEVLDDISTLASTEKLHIKSITETELRGATTAARYMLDKDDYKAAQEE